MPKLSLVVGGLMIALGVVGYVLTGRESVTALIPVAFGVLLSGAGALGLAKPEWRKHALHAALAVALLGLLGTARSFGKLGAVLEGTAERPAAVVAQVIFALLALVFLALGIKSFIDARRARAVQG